MTGADPVRAIADAVLYEGYLLWPYRRSALKNRRRFQFGGVFPPAHTRRHPDDRDAVQAEVLVQAGAGAQLEVTVRFLTLVQRAALAAGPEGLTPVDELIAGDERVLSFEEAAERQVTAAALSPDDLAAGVTVPIACPAGEECRDVRDAASGAVVGAVRRRWPALAGEASVRARASGGDLLRVSVRVANTTAFSGGGREAALRLAFCSTHVVVRVRGGAFVSLTDPPRELAGAAASCHNEGLWPVLVDAPGSRDTVLAAPIILEDHPRVAAQSPGDLFDGGEIDQLLTLNILALTDAEKAEMAATDSRAREILERTEALTRDQLMALHATVRGAE